METGTYSLVELGLLGFLELMGIGIAVARYRSDRRARTEDEHYIYSPTYKPYMKTPKLAFVPLPVVIATGLVTVGVRQMRWGQFSALVNLICTMMI